MSIAPDYQTSIGDRKIRPIKRSEYELLIRDGMFKDERVELIRGLLANRPPRTPPRVSTVQKLNKWLTEQSHDHFDVRVQLPLALSDYSELEPDLAVVALGDYEDEHPRTAALVIEVADPITDLERVKAPVYAAAGVGEYWIVDINARTVVVHSLPIGDRYAEVRTVTAKETLRPAALGIAIAAAEILLEA